ncbi:MAG: glycosyltransferase [Patescibacteria group bacterium]|nr:glycosyltransferase [Patescibacteria group bacterium]
MNKKLSVTIGIPAYNEEANIEQVLKSILTQKETFCEIKKIIVLSDGSSDKTNEIVVRMSHQNSKISLEVTNERKGKAYQLNKLYSLCDSNISLQFDADIVLFDDNVVDNMVYPFTTNNNITVISGNNIPLPGKTFIEKLTNGSDLLWQEVRLNYLDGRNIYNSSGCITAIRKSFLNSYKIPAGTVADQQYLYLSCVTSGGQFWVAKNAIVKYRSPSNLKDFFRQASRSLNEKKQIELMFSENIDHHYYIPRKIKYIAIIKRLLTSPIITSGAIMLQIILRFLPNQEAIPKNGLWTMIKSTKKIV